jgi:hypothetical protein
LTSFVARDRAVGGRLVPGRDIGEHGSQSARVGARRLTNKACDFIQLLIALGHFAINRRAGRIISHGKALSKKGLRIRTQPIATSLRICGFVHFQGVRHAIARAPAPDFMLSFHQQQEEGSAAMTQPDNLVLEHLRAIRADVGTMREDIAFLKEAQLGARNDVHELKGDLLRFEQRAEQRLDRIEKRLTLQDA